MNARENLLSLLKRKGFDYIPVEMGFCPSLIDEYKKQTNSDQSYQDYFKMPWENVSDMVLKAHDTKIYEKYFDKELLDRMHIDNWGVGHERGSESAKHMTYMRNPLRFVMELDELKKYPFPDYKNAFSEHQKKEVATIHAKGLAAIGNMQCTIWETSWYIRSMEELMMDMKSEDEKAEFILDKVMELNTYRAEAFVRAGVDILFLGDDIGMQSTIMMSKDLYTSWLKPRLKSLITAAKKVNPEVIIFYHSCGYIKPFIPDLIEIGVDVLNPIQPECMDFAEIHKEYGQDISFHGTIGTQTTMPFGKPEDVRRAVFKNLEIAGNKGGLFVAPTHVLEPEVPWENILSYVNACRDFSK
jgi:uroporphyrinogen decarboxylase